MRDGSDKKMRLSVVIGLAALVWMAGGVPGAAQDVSFTASAPKTTVALGEQFQVSFTLSGGSLKAYKDFRQPNLNASFLTLMGPSTSQSMQWINGRTSTSITWTYILQPRNTGTYSILPATIQYDGQTLASNALTIKVTAGAPGGQQQNPAQGGGKSDEAVKVDLGDNLFIKALVSKRSVYVGEPILVTYKLYSRVSFRVDNIAKVPRMVGFWSEDIDMPQQVRPEVESYGGKQYETYTMKKVVYFPTQTGTLTIDPFEINCTVQVRAKRKSGDDFFDRFFNDPFFDTYKNVQKSLLTEKIGVQVKPLPEQGKPYSFRGAVGDFTMQTSIDKTRLKVNETATMKVVLRGEGNIKLLEEPVIEFPNGIEHYDPKISEEIIRSGGTITGVKTFEYLLIPRYAGDMDIPAASFAFFNIGKNRYEERTGEAVRLRVEDDPNARVDETSRLRAERRRRDIHPLLPYDAEAASEPGRPGAGSMLLLFGAPLAALAGALVWKRRYDRVHGDVTGLRMRRATRLAEKHLARSKKYLQANNIDAYYLEIARALWGFVQNKLALPTSETSVDAVTEALVARALVPETVEAVRSALIATEAARFSPTRSSEDEMRGLYDTARTAIVSLEQALRA